MTFSLVSQSGLVVQNWNSGLMGVVTVPSPACAPRGLTEDNLLPCPPSGWKGGGIEGGEHVSFLLRALPEMHTSWVLRPQWPSPGCIGIPGKELVISWMIVSLDKTATTTGKGGFPYGSAGKESTCNVGNLGWEDPLEKGKATYSSIQNSIDWIVHGVAKSQTRLSNLHFFIGKGSIDIVGISRSSS